MEHDFVQVLREPDLWPDCIIGMIEDAAKILERLPRTADNHRVTHGDTVYDPDGRECRVIATTQYIPLDGYLAFHWSAYPVIRNKQAWNCSATRSIDIDCCFISPPDAAALKRAGL